jgi:serine/threonine protein kinase
MEFRLTVVQGSRKGDHIDITPGKKFILGRKKDCDLYLDDDLLSRHHCQIFLNEDTLYVEDLNSRNGTFVNGNQIQSCPVAVEDYISIGAHLLKCAGEKVTATVKSDVILCSRCGAPVLYPQPKPPYICLRCYKNYFKGEQINQYIKNFGHYEIQSLLGEGGISSVYLAVDTRDNSRVALKLLKTNSDSYIRRFEREGQIYARLSHPNIVNLRDSGKIGDSLYIAMEYVTGENLHEYVCRLGPLDAPTSLEILRLSTLGLGCAHQAGIIHRDIKPGNIIISGSALEEVEVKVVDFGLAKTLDSSPIDELTKEGSGLGSLMYVSPEQIVNAKTVTALTDIYGLGATLYFMLTIRHPFSADTPAETLIKIQNGNLDYNLIPPHTPPKVLEILRTCLQTEPSKRYPHTQALQEAIEKVQLSFPSRKNKNA